MRLAEAIRQFQAALEARRSAWDAAGVDEVEAMDDELIRARRTMEVAWLIDQAER